MIAKLRMMLALMGLSAWPVLGMPIYLFIPGQSLLNDLKDPLTLHLESQGMQVLLGPQVGAWVLSLHGYRDISPTQNVSTYRRVDISASLVCVDKSYHLPTTREVASSDTLAMSQFESFLNQKAAKTHAHPAPDWSKVDFASFQPRLDNGFVWRSIETAYSLNSPWKRDENTRFIRKELVDRIVEELSIWVLAAKKAPRFSAQSCSKDEDSVAITSPATAVASSSATAMASASAPIKQGGS